MGRKPMPTSPLSSGCDEEPIDWRPALLGLGAWLGSWLGTAGDWRYAACGVAVVGLLLVGRRWWNPRLLIALAMVLGVTLGLGYWRVWVAGQGPTAELARENAVVCVEAQLGEGRILTGGPGGDIWLAGARVLMVAGRGAAWQTGASVMLSAAGSLREAWSKVPAGSTVRATVRFGASEDLSVSAWASARAAPEVIAAPGLVDAAVNSVRAGLRDSVVGLPAGPAALVPALVVGDTTAMPAQLVDQFRLTGLTHLTAVSGANLTLLLAVVLWIAARMGVLGWWRRGLAVIVVVGFVLLCRAEPSVLRAASMGLVGLAALGWAGPRQGLRYLSWGVVFLVLADPWLARSVGFALSVLATAGIIAFARRWAQALGARLPMWLAEAISVPVAAQLATQPLVTAISGQVSVVGLAANLVAAPLVGPGTVLGFAAAWASVAVPALAKVLAWAAGGFAQALCWIAALGSALPGAAVVWPVNPLSITVLLVACVVLALTLPLLWRRPWLVGVVAVALVVACLRPLPPPGWPPPGWLVVSCDVGQGDATVLSVAPGSAIVVDAGPEPGPVRRCLDQLGITHVPWLVFTHPHADHIGGVAGVLQGRTLERLLLPATNTQAPGWGSVRAAAPNLEPLWAAPGLIVSAGATKLSVLALRRLVEGAATGADSAAENDSSLVLRAEVGGVRVLLAGDLEEPGQSATLASVPDLRAEVLLVPHHGSAHQSESFMAAVQPRVALLSVGADNSYGHPAARTLAGIQTLGARAFRTDQNGAVALTSGSDGLVVTTQREP